MCDSYCCYIQTWEQRTCLFGFIFYALILKDKFQNHYFQKIFCYNLECDNFEEIYKKICKNK